MGAAFWWGQILVIVGNPDVLNNFKNVAEIDEPKFYKPPKKCKPHKSQASPLRTDIKSIFNLGNCWGIVLLSFSTCINVCQRCLFKRKHCSTTSRQFPLAKWFYFIFQWAKNLRIQQSNPGYTFEVVSDF